MDKPVEQALMAIMVRVQVRADTHVFACARTRVSAHGLAQHFARACKCVAPVILLPPMFGPPSPVPMRNCLLPASERFVAAHGGCCAACHAQPAASSIPQAGPPTYHPPLPLQSWQVHHQLPPSPS